MESISNDLLGQTYSAWTLRLFEKLEDQIVRYFTEMMKHCYKAASKPLPEVYGMFQTMCVHLTQWSMVEMDRQRKILQKALGHRAEKAPDPNLWISMSDKDFSNLVMTILKLHFSVLAVVRINDIDEIVLPKVDVNRFIWKCFEKVGLSVAKRSPQFFDAISFTGKERLRNHAEAIKRVQQCLYSVLNDFVPLHQLMSSSPRAKVLPYKEVAIPKAPPIPKIPVKKWIEPKTEKEMSHSLKKPINSFTIKSSVLLPKKQRPRSKSEILPAFKSKSEKKVPVPLVASFVVPKSPVKSPNAIPQDKQNQISPEIINEYFDQDDHDPIPIQENVLITQQEVLEQPLLKLESVQIPLGSGKNPSQNIYSPKLGTLDLDEDELITNLSSKYLAITASKRSQSMIIPKTKVSLNKQGSLFRKPEFESLMDQSHREIQSMIQPSVRSEAPKPAFMKIVPEELKSRTFFKPNDS